MARKQSDVQRSIEMRKRAPKIPAELIDAMLSGGMTGEQINEAALQFKRALIERLLSAELTDHLGYAAGAEKPEGVSNERNGSTEKTVRTGAGPLRIEVPRDREGSFAPLLIPKHERRFTGFDEQILALYARGMTMRDIQSMLRDSYRVEVSAEFISTVTDEVLAEVGTWQSRPLEPVYAVVFFDALRVKIREDAVLHSKAVYLALGVKTDGTRDILGLWIEQTEGAKFWLNVFNDLKTRGVGDVLIAVTDGLKGLPDALEVAFPQTTLQTCIVHLIRNSLDHVGWKDRKPLAQALRPIYTAVNPQAAQTALEAFETGPFGQRLPAIAAAWRRAWDRVIPFFAFPPAIRRLIYTTNALESVHARIRKVIKTRGHFPHDEAASKLIWLALRNITANWSRPSADWKAAMQQFAIVYGERFRPTTASSV